MSTLLEVIAHTLEEGFKPGGSLHPPLEALERLGLSLTLRLDVSVEARPARVVVPSLKGGTTSWTAEDRDMLRALGIVLDDAETDGPPHEPRRRQPR